MFGDHFENHNNFISQWISEHNPSMDMSNMLTLRVKEKEARQRINLICWQNQLTHVITIL